MATTLIKDATIIDGTGKSAKKGDVLIKDNRILAMGTFPNKKADTIIDALGMTLTPGFIDVHNESDHYLTLFTNPTHEDFLLQGVTTIIGGQCGASLAPLLYGSLETIRKWADINQINVNWHSFEEFKHVMEQRSFGVNVATLIGHSTIRRAIIGEAVRDLTTNELKVMKRLVHESLEAGALGLSTGLSYAHTRETPYHELKEIVSIIKEYKGIYSTHLRDETKHIVGSVEETVRLAKETGAKILISHFRPLKGFEKEYGEAFEYFDKKGNAYGMGFDTNASDHALMPLYTLLPRWAQHGNLETMEQSLREASTRDRIQGELLKELRDADCVIVSAPNTESSEGKSLSEFGKERQLSLTEAFFELARITKLRAVVWGKNTNVDFKIQTLQHPRAFIGSHRPSIQKRNNTPLPQELISSFPQFLKVTTSLNLLSLPEAVRRITSMPAEQFGLKDRGTIKEGAIADLVLMRDMVPMEAWVDGESAVRDGDSTKALKGKLLLRNS